MAEKKSKVAEIKTKPTVASVEAYINTVPDEQQRKDSFVLVDMMKQATGEDPLLWGSGIIGFGNKRYKSPASGREVDWFLVGFAPRKANLSLYVSIMMGEHTEALKHLGKHKTGGGCVYINKLSDVNMDVLKSIIAAAVNRD
jgi:hypothetical protein